MSCGCGSSRTIVVGTDDSVAFQLATDGRAYNFELATEVTCRFITTDAKGSTGNPVEIFNVGSNDWRSGYGEAVFAAEETAVMEPGTYILEIKILQPAVGTRIFRTSEIVQILPNPV